MSDLEYLGIAWLMMLTAAVLSYAGLHALVYICEWFILGRSPIDKEENDDSKG